VTCENECGFSAVPVLKTAVSLFSMSSGKILCQKQHAQVCLCMAPPQSGTVCGTVRSSPGSVRTAFLWKIKTNRMWCSSRV